MKIIKSTKEKAPFRGKVLAINRRTAAILAGIAAAAAIFCAVCSPRVVGAAATARRLPIYCVARDDKACALSFDAAWGNEDTQQLIDILARYNVKTTFFVVGEWVDKYPESVKALSDAGHEVMNHSQDHAHFTQLSAEEIAANRALDVRRFLQGNPIDDVLDISSSSSACSTPSPAYGGHLGLVEGQQVAVSCGQSPWTNAAQTESFACSGWKLYDEAGNLLSSGPETSFTYTHPNPAAYRRLEWQWVGSSS